MTSLQAIPERKVVHVCLWRIKKVHVDQNINGEVSTCASYVTISSTAVVKPCDVSITGLHDCTTSAHGTRKPADDIVEWQPILPDELGVIAAEHIVLCNVDVDL